jgi:hypothetical protein
MKRTWLRHYAASLKVLDMIPDEVIEFFNWLNPTNLTMVLGSTEPPTEMSTRNLPGDKGRPAHKAGNFTSICEPIAYKMWEPRRLTTLWSSVACYRNRFTLLLTDVRHVEIEIKLYNKINSFIKIHFD